MLIGLMSDGKLGGLFSEMSFKIVEIQWLVRDASICVQGEFQEQQAIYIKSVVAGGAADMVSYHSSINFSLYFLLVGVRVAFYTLIVKVN